MNQAELLTEVDRILDDAKTALMTTVDEKGRPRVRWMTPRRMRGRPAYLYTVSEKDTTKVQQVRNNPATAWLIQTPTLSQVIAVYGPTSVIESATLLQEFLETVGKDLFMIWKLNPAPSRPDFVVLETVIEEASYFDTASGETQSFKF